MNESEKIIIAIDGHSSCGKSTLARKIACKLGYIYIDSGAMYRAVSWFAVQQSYIGDGFFDRDALIRAMPDISISFETDNSGRPVTFLNGTNVEKHIRSLAVSRFVSTVSTVCEVRKHLVDMQRSIAQNGGVVMDGRDIGTVVFPDAALKIFLTASPEVRAQRRFKELSDKGEIVSFNEVLQNLMQRDATDQSRTASPLRMANDAMLLDNSHLDANQTFELAMSMVNDVMGNNIRT